MRVARGDQASLRRLTEISRALTYARSLAEVLDLTIDCSMELLGASRAVLMLIGDDALLHIRASRGIEEESVERFSEPLDENLLTRLAGLLGDEIHDRFLGVPLVVHGDVIGLLGVRRDVPGPASDDDEWLLSAVADQAAVALESTRHQEVKESLSGRLGELERGQKSKDQAIEILSHDLRSPLNAIQGYASLLSAEVAGPVNERQRDILTRLTRVSGHMEALLENVLEMARLSGGQVTIRNTRTRLEKVIAEAVDIVTPAAREARIELETAGVEPEMTLETDPARLRQVLVHLIDNAVKYGPEDSVVRVEWRAAELRGRPWAEIAVIDRGPGISEERREAIFEPWVRDDGETSRARSGVGLGLSIALGLVRHLGGRLLLESEVGRGSTFRVRLPLGGT